MRVLIVGGGGREHALAWKLRQDDPNIELIAAPGNPGLAQLARCAPVPANDAERLAALAESERVTMTLVGPEAPLAVGIVDRFRARGLPIFGPTRYAAEVETSKSAAKEIMGKGEVPTARAERHTDPDQAKRAAREFGAPVVIKASGLAAGKGVIVCQSMEEADRAIDSMLRLGAFGAAGTELLVEEFLDGEELSVFAMTDGTRVLPMLPAQDHKRLLEGDRGPNTGGMGAYAPVSIGGSMFVDEVVTRVFHPTLTVLREQGRPFTGLLYAGLMLTSQGLRVIEFNCRFGDPETQTLLPLMDSSLLEPMFAVATEEGLAGASSFSWRAAHAVTTVVAAAGYPERPRTGDRITLPKPTKGVELFHAGTAVAPGGALVTSGGRVIAVTAVAATLAEAQERSVRGAEAIQFEGRQYRSDIAWRELSRSPGAGAA
ncbi:MAG TPA: phosphoribosylamine--glycine ligase [Gemmatimonadaceae bacterium]|nr:phosphoribosylamine--glycine ligase [Gemmatimonadaceae bacterium]